MTRSFVAPLILFITLAFVACDESTPPHAASPKEVPEQDLKITYGGFMQNGPEDQLLDGVCGTDVTRNTVNCDIHNGLMGWNVTEITFQVVAPETTNNTTIVNGYQLPH